MALTAYVPNMDEPAKRPAAGAHHAALASTHNVALLGFGTVGQAVAEILCLTPDSNLRLTHVFNREVERKRSAWVPEDVHWTSNFGEVLASEADIVVELMGGVEPACDFIRRALLSGKSVVTANKHVMAMHGSELLQLARQTGQRLEYGASVGGAVPVLPALQYGLRGDRLFRIRGILNGTCNFVLSNMEAHGTSLAAALAKAQELGYAEKDPSDDIHGLDAACKLAILVRLAFQADLNAFEIPRQSIDGIEPADFHFAKHLDCTIRQISYAELNGSHLQASVGPALVPRRSPLARMVDNQNAIFLTGEKTGDTLLAGRGAGGDATAVAVVSDLLAITQRLGSFGSASVLKSYPSEEFVNTYYLRFAVNKRANTIPSVQRILAEQGIRVRKMIEHSYQGTSQVALLLEKCGRLHLQRAIEPLAQLHGISRPPRFISVLD